MRESEGAAEFAGACLGGGLLAGLVTGTSSFRRGLDGGRELVGLAAEGGEDDLVAADVLLAEAFVVGETGGLPRRHYSPLDSGGPRNQI